MPNQNGGTTEYTNIINGIEGIDTKIDEQQLLLQNEFGKKILADEVSTPLNEQGHNLAQAGILLGGIATVATRNVTGDILAAQAMIAARQLALKEGLLVVGEKVAATSAAAAATVATGNVVATGGIGGLVAAGRGLLLCVGRVLGLLANVGIILYQLWQLLSAMCSFQADIGGRVAELETELGAEKAKTRRLQQKMAAMEIKMNQLPEKVARQIERPGGVLHSIGNTSVEIKNTVGEVKNTVGEVKNTVGEVKNTVGEVKNTVGEVKNTVGEVKNTVGEVKNTVTEKFKKLFDWLPIGQIFSVLAFITSLHNAAMLSSNLVTTLTSIIDVALDIVGIKGVEGASVNVSEILGQKASELAKTVLGAENFTDLTDTWKKTNRFYQASMNIANSIQSMIDSTRSIVEMGAENTGKIGNALKKAGVVFENAYNWMPENVNSATQKMRAMALINQEIQNLDEAASTISTVVSEVKSIQDTVAEMKQQRQEWNTAKQEAERALTNLQNQEKRDSASEIVTQDDLNPPSSLTEGGA